MNYTKLQWCDRFQKYYTEFPTLGLAVDLSRMNVDDEFFVAMEQKIQRALAPTPEIRREFEESIDRIKKFAEKFHMSQIRGAGGAFEHYFLIGIGGSALGPQFVAHTLGDPRTDKLEPHFVDNTDPDGMDRVLATIGSRLSKTLCIVISKSGDTKKTHNGVLVAKDAFEHAGLDYGMHTVTVTSAGSELDKYAVQNKCLEQFPMWDWVGGRTSELLSGGLLLAVLQ
jgi:glucose-6-phosphate isomerase